MPRVFKVGKAIAEKAASTARNVFSYGKATARWIAAGRPIRSTKQQQAILDICKACPKYEPSKNPKRPGRCGLCTCSLNLSTSGNSKIAMGTESCPDQPPRWLALTPTPQKEVVMSEQALGGFASSTEAVPAVPEKPLSRGERRRARIEARNARIAARNAQRASQAITAATSGPKLTKAERISKRKAEEIALGGEMPPKADIAIPETDQLLMYGANGSPIGHALRNLWLGTAAFLVGGGPSLQALDLGFLRERGIVSLGVNNVGGYAPVRAWTFSDPACKFHHGIFMDPSIIKFVPRPKLRERVRAKLDDGTFQWTGYEVRQCPSVFGYDRHTRWVPDEFLTSPEASWGPSKKHPENKDKPTVLFTLFLGMRLLHYLGVRRVYLLGVDFTMSETQHYAFGQDRTDSAVRSNTNSYRVAAGLLHDMRPIFEKAGFEVLQTNKSSGLKVFDHVPLAEAIEDCRGCVPKEPWPADAFAGWYEKPGGEEDRE